MFRARLLQGQRHLVSLPTVRPIRMIPYSLTHAFHSTRLTLNANGHKVTTTSSTTPITTGVHADTRSPIMPASGPGSSQLVDEIKSIGKTVEGVPEPALHVGLAGTLPYLGTALSSLYLSWNVSKNHSDFEGNFSEKLVLFDSATAEQLLEYAQVIQVGYGASIISFLGAVHWGLEFAGYGGSLGYRRYLYGAAPALIAWPSILLPINTALVVHFVTFTGIWFFDSRASRKGFAPPWYNNYRFLLTFIVCTSILLTLVVSGWLGDPQTRSTRSSRLEDLRQHQAQQLQQDTKRAQAAAKQSSSESRMKRQTDSQEDLNEKVKEAQKKEKKAARESDSNEDNAEKSPSAAPPTLKDDVDQNGDKAGGKKGSKSPVGSADRAQQAADSVDPVAEKNTGKTTSKKDTAREATEGEGAKKAAAQK
ncbi:hypothetical protein PYCC9005_004174 [Savitreella phatthalungensis]